MIIHTSFGLKDSQLCIYNCRRNKHYIPDTSQHSQAASLPEFCLMRLERLLGHDQHACGSYQSCNIETVYTTENLETSVEPRNQVERPYIDRISSNTTCHIDL